ncbi:unnamed protein product [Chondrus crispus]|uniref:DDE-1 domain-containing protein n=1 Tax=Chondrus crispus TaxID=2769 RepID=R7QEC0_CHOCR|nr:unnamed protein product [Chondrus crispus]CDF36103.1 unnamed protein product [Chondrus crispus]|eukprot:XP_005715922.1 unnamed protein product [Chondrus crispus]
MSKQLRREKRAKRRIHEAFNAVIAGSSRRDGAKIARLPVSTFQYQFQKHITSESMSQKPKFDARNALTEKEETSIVELVKRYASQARPLTRSDVADAVEIIVKHMTPERREKVPFIADRPGKKFIRNFETRHQSVIKIGKASRQDALRYRATNAQNLTTHFAELESIIKTFHIDSSRICNIDETGYSPNRDASGRMRTKPYCTKGVVSQYRAAFFKNVHRVTLLPAIFACGSVGTPTFVVQGASVAYRVINVDGAELLESFADCLPPHVNITTRRELAGVDKFIFERWAKAFVQYCLPLRANARKVLLVYDGYRSHMGLKIFEIVREGNIIAYALPAHTSGTTQPLDLHVFRSSKENLNTKIAQTGMHVVNMELDTFDFLRLITAPYATSFTRDNVLKSFAASGISPFNPLAVLNVPRPFSEA